MALTLILAVGHDPELLGTRSAILQTASCVAIPAISINEAIEHFMANDFDLVLLCHTIAAPDRDRLTSLIRATGSPTPIVTIAPLTDQISDAVDDATIAADPVRFLRGIEDACSKHAKVYRMRGAGLKSMRAAQVATAAEPGNGRVIEMQPSPAAAEALDLTPDRDDAQDPDLDTRERP